MFCTLRTLSLCALMVMAQRCPAEQLLFGAETSIQAYDTATDQLGPALTITGLDSLRSIDFRADGRLYALDAAPQPQLYTLDLVTGAATPLGASLAALSGSSFLDMDFTANDQLRIVSYDTGAHLLVDPNTGTVIQSGPPLNVLGIGHAGGSIYGIGGDSLHSLVAVDVASGSLTPVGEIIGFPVPAFGFGFDVSPGTGKAYGYYDTAFGFPDGELYEIDLATGQASLLRRSSLFIPTLTVVPVPEPGTMLLLAAAAVVFLVRRR